MVLEQERASRDRLSTRKVTAYVILVVGVFLLVSTLVCLLFPGVFTNGLLKDRISKALIKIYPEYSIQIAGMHYNVWENRLGCDSIKLTAMDSSLSCRIVTFSVSGIGRMHFLRLGSLDLDNLASLVIDVHDIVLNFPHIQYELHCGRLHVSIQDSMIVAETLEFHPLISDEQFFAGSKFRRTRFRCVISQCRVMGFANLELPQGKNYRARLAQIEDASFDVLINKDKPVSVDTISPLMPNELLSLIKQGIQIDSLTVVNGRLKYGEKFAVLSEPAILTLDSIQMMAGGISNQPNHRATTVIHAQGILMKTGTMKVLMSIPTVSQEFSLQYSGSLSPMNLNEFNPFIEISEGKRIKTGSLRSAIFDIQVKAGHASGIVRTVYKDLKLVYINDRTGSESGIGNTIISFVANNMKLRTTNMPDKSGSIKIGQVKYVRKQEETFFEFAWFALRSGLGDVVGF